MSELDTFETRFAAAYRRYLDKAPRQLDAAAVVRTVTAQPRGRALAWPWTFRPLVFRPAQALAWLVVLGLLLALMAAAIFVGSQPVRPLPAVLPPVGQVFVCPPGSNPNTPGPVDQVRPPGFSGMAFDRRAGRLLTLWDTEIWTFDVCTNTWRQMHPTLQPPRSLVGPLVYDIDSDVTIGVAGPDEAPGNMWAYDLAANTWTEKGPFAPFAHPILSSLSFYDPVSGRVVARADDGDVDTLGLALWGYEVETDTWTPMSPVQPLVVGPHIEFFAYDASVNRLVAYAKTWGPADAIGNRQFGTKTWLFDLRSGTWSGMDAVTPSPFSAGMWGYVPGIAYDEAAQRTVMMGQGYSAAYDATADRWQMLYETQSEEWNACVGTRPPRPECLQAPDLIFDSVNKRLVVYGGFFASAELGFAGLDDIMAFDTRTGEWTTLLAAPQ